MRGNAGRLYYLGPLADCVPDLVAKDSITVFRHIRSAVMVEVRNARPPVGRHQARSRSKVPAGTMVSRQPEFPISAIFVGGCAPDLSPNPTQSLSSKTHAGNIILHGLRPSLLGGNCRLIHSWNVSTFEQTWLRLCAILISPPFVVVGVDASANRQCCPRPRTAHRPALRYCRRL
jgi:hypothetical protein